MINSTHSGEKLTWPGVTKWHVFHSGLYFTPDWDAPQRGINHAPLKFLSHISLRIELGLHLSTPNDSNPDWKIKVCHLRHSFQQLQNLFMFCCASNCEFSKVLRTSFSNLHHFISNFHPICEFPKIPCAFFSDIIAEVMFLLYYSKVCDISTYSPWWQTLE